MSIIFYALDVLPFFELYSSIIAMGNRIGFSSKLIPNILLVDLHKLYKFAYVRSCSQLREKLQGDQDFVYSNWEVIELTSDICAHLRRGR